MPLFCLIDIELYYLCNVNFSLVNCIIKVIIVIVTTRLLLGKKGYLMLKDYLVKVIALLRYFLDSLLSMALLHIAESNEPIIKGCWKMNT